jgi:hypothetical protein
MNIMRSQFSRRYLDEHKYELHSGNMAIVLRDLERIFKYDTKDAEGHREMIYLIMFKKHSLFHKLIIIHIQDHYYSLHTKKIRNSLTVCK